MELVKYLRYQEEKAAELQKSEEFERALFINNYELWFKMYGEETGGGIFTPQTEEDFEQMVREWEGDGYDPQG